MNSLRSGQQMNLVWFPFLHLFTIEFHLIIVAVRVFDFGFRGVAAVAVKFLLSVCATVIDCNSRRFSWIRWIMLCVREVNRVNFVLNYSSKFKSDLERTNLMGQQCNSYLVTCRGVRNWRRLQLAFLVCKQQTSLSHDPSFSICLLFDEPGWMKHR